MTTTQEVKWEELDSLDSIKVGDELEYTVKGPNFESRNWGKVTRVSDVHGTLVYVEGDWHLVDKSLSVHDQRVLLKRKVVSPTYPTKIGAVIAYERSVGDGILEVVTYVRIDDRADNAVWVKASNGERWAEWEIELIHSDETMVVVSDGT